MGRGGGGGGTQRVLLPPKLAAELTKAHLPRMPGKRRTVVGSAVSPTRFAPAPRIPIRSGWCAGAGPAVWVSWGFGA